MAKKLQTKLGDVYRDKVSGWSGIATAEYHYLNGCVRVEISDSDDKGQPKSFVFDIEQIEAVKNPKRQPVKTAATPTGGPRGSSPVER